VNEETRYRHTPDMGEISGFGGGYEALCQDMLEAGAKWIVATQAKRTVHLKGHSYEGVTGIMVPDSDDAKALEKAMMAADKDKAATGAMHHVVMSRLFYIEANGWEKYCERLREREADEASGDE
jgi:hypothetical protein